jgi:hypothetical protein
MVLLRRTSQAMLAAAVLALVLAGASGASSAAAASLSLSPELAAPGLGQGATLTLKLGFTGSEYLGSPAPLTGATVTLPVGTTASGAGFASCAAMVLETLGPTGCPPGSAAGGMASTQVYVSPGSIDGVRDEENAESTAYFASAGGLDVYVSGKTPVAFAMTIPASLAGNVLTLAPKLLAPLEDPADLSFRSLVVELGIARALKGASAYSVHAPEECPTGGFSWAAGAALYQAPNSGFGSEAPGQLSASAQTPCPRGSSDEASLPGSEGIITAPSGKQCVSRRDFVIHVQQIKGLVYRSVSVYVNASRVAVVKGRRFHARVDLRGLPRGRYTVQIAVITTSGRRIAGTRAYHTCAATPKRSGRPAL